MQGDIDSIAKTVMQSPQGLKIITGLDRFNTTLSSENGKQLIALLAGTGSDSLKAAAQATQSASKDVGRQMISNLLGTKDGAALVGKIIELLGL